MLVVKDAAVPRVMLPGFSCTRCPHKWVPRDLSKDPTVCPKCKSPYWNTPKGEKAAKSKARRSRG